MEGLQREEILIRLVGMRLGGRLDVNIVVWGLYEKGTTLRGICVPNERLLWRMKENWSMNSGYISHT